MLCQAGAGLPGSGHPFAVVPPRGIYPAYLHGSPLPASGKHHQCTGSHVFLAVSALCTADADLHPSHHDARRTGHRGPVARDFVPRPGGQPAFRGRPARAQFRPRPVLLPGQLRKLYPYTQQTLRRILQRPSSAAQAQAAYIGLPLKKQGNWGKGTFLKKCPFPQTCQRGSHLSPLAMTFVLAGSLEFSGVIQPNEPLQSRKGLPVWESFLKGAFSQARRSLPPPSGTSTDGEGILRSPYEDCQAGSRAYPFPAVEKQKEVL